MPSKCTITLQTDPSMNKDSILRVSDINYQFSKGRRRVWWGGGNLCWVSEARVCFPGLSVTAMVMCLFQISRAWFALHIITFS